MRVRTFVTWLVFLAAFGWVAYTVAFAGWNYFSTQAMIDKVLWEATGRYKIALAMGTPAALDKLVAEVRSSIVYAARREGLPIQEENVSVSVNSAGILVTARWFYPIIRYEGRELLVVPISAQRSFVPPP